MSVCFLRISLLLHSLRFFLFLFFLFQLLPADPGMKRQHILFRLVPHSGDITVDEFKEDYDVIEVNPPGNV